MKAGWGRRLDNDFHIFDLVLLLMNISDARILIENALLGTFFVLIGLIMEQSELSSLDSNLI